MLLFPSFGCVFLLEALDASGRIDQLLLSCKKWVAVGADFDADHVALESRPCLKRASAGAMHGDRVIIGMNAFFHYKLHSAGRSAREEKLVYPLASLGQHRNPHSNALENIFLRRRTGQRRVKKRRNSQLACVRFREAGYRSCEELLELGVKSERARQH